jgi:RNA polymerase sigma factor (sigma-70 family)
MDQNLRIGGAGGGKADSRGLLNGREGLAESLYAQAGASRWGLGRTAFTAALERSARKGFQGADASLEKVQEYLAGLHLEDLALACACMEGCELAWEHFVENYRGYLRSAAAAILRRGAGVAEACELADSLFAELYGLSDGKCGERSLFRYFHGRSTLRTWLRAVLAQRHVDALRATRRFETLEEGNEPTSHTALPAGARILQPDPHRQRYVELFSRALHAALAQLDPRDAQRLYLYYAREQTLATIGKQLGEHESSVSRNLERVRVELRGAVEETLRAGCPAANGSAAQKGLSEAELVLCFEYAAEDAPLDLQRVFGQRGAQNASVRSQESE